MGDVLMDTFKQYLAEAARVDTDKFVASHGKKPSGRGLWLFDISGTQFSHNGSYGDAVKAAKKAATATKKTAPVITVLP